MKHILIILSFLLLTSPLFGDNHKGETLYLWKTSSGVQWKGFGDKQTHPVYKGHVENGKPNGQGTLNLRNGEKYVGEYKDGKRNGQGTLTFPDGSTFSEGKKYEGEWKDGKPWNGILYDKKGNILYNIVNGI